MRHLTTLLTVLAMFLTATPVLAQESSSSTYESLRPERVVSSSLAASGERSAFQRSDSVKDGAIVGAVVGGAAMAAFMTMLIRNVGCVAEDTPCGREVAIASLMTAGAAGAGALIGAGIDSAVHDRQPTFGGRQGVSPTLTPKRASITVGIRW